MRSLVAAAIALAGCLSSPPGAGSGDGGTGGPDADTRALLGVEYQPGAQVAGTLYEHADGRQGTILLWITLGPDAGDLEGLVELVHLAGFSIEVDRAGSKVVVRRDGGAVPADEISTSVPGWEPDSSHLITLRWDGKLALAGLQHATLRVDAGEAVPGIDDPFVAELEPDTPQVVRGGLAPADGPIQVRSAFVLRRPIREDDPPGGVNLGIADEHEVIFEAGPDADPTLVIGSWDVVFGLSPHGDPAVRQPFLGWSQPHGENLLGGGFMQLDDFEADGWTLTDLSSTLGGAPATVAGATGTLNAGYSVGNGFLSHELRLGQEIASGDRLTLRVLAYPTQASGATANVCVGALGDPCAENLLVGRQNSSRLGPDVLFLTYEVGDQDIEVRLSMSDSDGAGTRPIVVFSQAELYRNLIVNPGFEQAGADNLPDGWGASEGLIDSEVTRDEGEWSSGTASLDITSNSPANQVPDAVLQEPAGMADFELYLVGGFFKRVGSEPAGISVTDGSLYRQNADFGEGGKLAVPDPGGSGVWHHRFGVGKRLVDGTAGLNDVIRWGGTEPRQLTRVWVDDAYLIRLAPVNLTFLYDPP